MSLNYISSAEAFVEAEGRLRDMQLQSKIGQYLGGVWPRGFEVPSEPKAIFAPYLARGSELEVEFLLLAADSGLDPVVATYVQSEYVTANPGLVDCYNTPFVLPKGQRRRDWIVAEENRPGAIGEARTIFKGLDITNYWDAVREAVLAENSSPKNIVTDFSGWYNFQAYRFGWKGERNKSPYYYNALMGLYASGRAVLFDTPATKFAINVMSPAAKNAREQLKVEPLIVCEFEPSKRDWVDISFLNEATCETLREKGKIG